MAEPERDLCTGKIRNQIQCYCGISASQIVFSSDYFLALKASKALLELSHKNADRTRIETQVAVAKAYYGVLVFNKRMQLLEANIERTRKLKDDTKALNDNGFVEKIDLDRVELIYNNLLVEKEKLQQCSNLQNMP